MTPDELKALRAAAGWTQAKAARIVGVTPRGFFNWESGARAIPKAAADLLRIKARQKGK